MMNRMATELRRLRAFVIVGFLGLIVCAVSRADEPRTARRKPPAVSRESANSVSSNSRIPADTSSTQPTVRSTQLDIEILSDTAGAGLDAQTWAKTFDDLGRSVRIRYAEGDEKPSVTESAIGGQRTVRIIGRLDRGTLKFPGKSFKSRDQRALGEWLDEREAYGAQGSPEGKRNWGLNRDQFTKVFTALSTPIDFETLDQPLLEVAEKLRLTSDLGLTVHTSAQDKWRGEGTSIKGLQEVRGLTAGSGFAVLLADHGLCMRPQRTPKGAVELVVQLRSEIDDPWPIGWEPKEDVARSEVVPELFRFRPIGFLSRPMLETLDAAEAETGVVIVVDFWKAKEDDINLAEYRYGLPRAKTAWVLVIRSAMGKSQMQPQFRADELGTGFVWITPLENRVTNK
jgi:hypothetical protein